MLISSNLPHSLASLMVDVAVLPTEFSACRYDRIVEPLDQGVDYEILILRLSDASPLIFDPGQLCLLPSNKFVSELAV